MGCDIHTYIEIKNKNGQWEYIPCDLDNHRDYYGFHFLAEVRDCGPFGSICPPKGMPSNASREVQGFCANIGVDGHSHSFFSLADLISQINQKSSKFIGFTPLNKYQNVKKKIKDMEELNLPLPKGVNLDNILSMSEADELVKNNKDNVNDKFVNIIYDLKIIQDSSLIFDIVTHLVNIAKGKQLSHDNIRLVFWFDN